MDVLGLLATAVLTKEGLVDSPTQTLREQQVLKPLSNQQNIPREPMPLMYEPIAPVTPVYQLDAQPSEQLMTGNNQLQNSIEALETHTQVTSVHQLEARSISEQFATEQNQLRNRVEALETRTSNLEVQRFSPTAFLTGEAVWGVSGVSGRDHDDPIVFQGSVELSLNVSFTGEDILEVGLESGKATEFSFVDKITFEGRLGFPANTDGLFELSELSYEFPISDRASLYVSTTSNDLDDFNPFLGDGGDSSDNAVSGAISEFGAENPIHNLVEDTGLQLNYDLTDELSISLGYFSGEASDSESVADLFNGNRSAFVQLGLEPSNHFLLGLTYIYSYNDSSLATETGSLRSQIDLERPVFGHSYGISVSFAPSPRLAIGGWIGLTNATVIGL